VLHSPESEPEKTVRLFLDAEFSAILRSEILTPEGSVSKSMELLSFQRTDAIYLPKVIDYRDHTDGTGKTRIEVKSSNSNPQFPDSIFSPEALKDAPVQPPFGGL
jgi:hypothetical protein